MECQKHLFSLPGNHHYLNCAYMSPLLRSAEEAGIAGIREKRTPWITRPEDFFDDSDRLRELFARLVNAGDPRRIAILPSASYGLATVARNLPPESGKNIVVAGEQFPSNVYCWMRYCREHDSELRIVSAPEHGNSGPGRGERWNERLIEAIDGNTLLVALGNVHWADGTLFDLRAIGAQARSVGAWFVIDGTQSVGALPFDLREIRPDALICAGYKWLMGPYTIALGYFDERLLEGVPLEEGWIARKQSEKFGGLVEYEEEYQPGAIRFDMGERSNFIQVPMMIEALKQILAWGPAGIQAYCRELTTGLRVELAPLGYRLEEEQWRAHHLFGIRLPEQIKPAGLQRELEQRNIHVSVRGSAVRVSPNVYNEKTDMEALVETLREMA